MNLPARIWLTVFAGIGVNRGSRTNGCWKDEGRPRLAELTEDGTEGEVPVAIARLGIAKQGGAKVDIKEGTESICLPCGATG